MLDSMEHNLKPSAADQLMNALRQDIKGALPICGLVPTENILFPEFGEVCFISIVLGTNSLHSAYVKQKSNNCPYIFHWSVSTSM